ncbi:MAG: iron ABC transporter substrate-binding protein [Chloroflexi bacterium]|nr:iron ABC transporter substrate-binding protein [Chloroflexota bacterium]
MPQPEIARVSSPVRRRGSHFIGVVLAALVAGLLFLAACGPAAAPPSAGPAPIAAPGSSTAAITVYSGRTKSLVGPLLDQVGKDTGVEVRVRYGDTAQLAAAILEEGSRTPADVFFAQDAGALGALSKAAMFTVLPDSVLNRVDAKFRSPKGEWVGVSGRARVVVYNTQLLKESDLPDSIQGFTDAKWKGRIGWPPTNGSFQAFVTALRKTEGDRGAREWLEGIKANNPRSYKDNTATVLAVAAGEVQVGFVNHYYLFGQIKQKGESFPARNYYPKKGDVGAMMNVAGAGILKVSRNPDAAARFVDYLLSEAAQKYFVNETFEYPMASGVTTYPGVKPLSEIEFPNMDLSNLEDLEGTLKLLRDMGVL